MPNKLDELKSALEKLDTAELDKKTDLEKLLADEFDPIADLNSIGAFTIGNLNTANNSYSTVGSNGYQNITINSSGTGNSFWTSSAPYTTSYTSDHSISVNGEDADVVINGKSLKSFMEAMEDRLAILTPDLEKLEKFTALKKAYEQYKLMEKLCQEDLDAESE